MTNAFEEFKAWLFESEGLEYNDEDPAHRQLRRAFQGGWDARVAQT